MNQSVNCSTFSNIDDNYLGICVWDRIWGKIICNHTLKLSTIEIECLVAPNLPLFCITFRLFMSLPQHFPNNFPSLCTRILQQVKWFSEICIWMLHRAVKQKEFNFIFLLAVRKMNKQLILIVIFSVVMLGVITAVAGHNGHFEWNGNFEYIHCIQKFEHTHRD